MYLAGFNIKANYITDSGGLALVKDFTVGLTVVSISRILGGAINTVGVSNTQYRPIPVRTNTDNSRHTYELDEGGYLIVFAQGLKRLPRDAVAYIEGNASCKQVGCSIIPERYYELRGQGNLSAVLTVSSGCHVTIEQGASVADISIIYEKFEEV